jgi:hypothetical protein
VVPRSRIRTPSIGASENAKVEFDRALVDSAPRYASSRGTTTPLSSAAVGVGSTFGREHATRPRAEEWSVLITFREP